MNENKIEKEILNQIITWMKSAPDATAEEIENKIIQEIKKRDRLKEDWQIHYAKERIIETIREQKKYEYAGFWKRLVAFTVDLIIGCIVGYILVYILSYIMVTSNPSSFFVTEIVIRISSIMLAWAYSAGMESSQTQGTLGKIALGIKVIDLDGSRISFGKATGRYFAKIVSSIFFIGLFMTAFTEKKQGLHDKMAGCLVVNK